MTDETDANLPPGPWSYEEVRSEKSRYEGSGHVYLLDANGRKIASIWGKPDEKMALVAYMIEARDYGLSGSRE